MPSPEEKLAKRRIRDRAWRAKNRDKLNAYRRTWNTANAPQRRATRRAGSYGLTPADVETMSTTQEGRCAICGSAFFLQSDGRTSARIDHDHTTGKVRGLLCHCCNVGLGNFKDNRSSLAKASTYLRKHMHSTDPFDDVVLCDGEGDPVGSYYDASPEALQAVWAAHKHTGVPAPIDLIDALAGHGIIVR